MSDHQTLELEVPVRRGRPQSPAHTPEGRRIVALMEIYHLETPTAFAQAIGVSQPRLSNVTAGGLPLGKELAFAIVKRFPMVGLEFLWFGDPAGIKSMELSEALKTYEAKTGIRLFSQRR